MDSHNINKKNPYSFNYVKKKILKELQEYKKNFIIIKIPVVSSVVYGRKVGYKIRKIKLPSNIEKISAMLNYLFSNFCCRYSFNNRPYNRKYKKFKKNCNQN